MITNKNFQHYLRWLVKISDTNPIRYEEIPKEFQDFFSIPGLSQALNISIKNPPSSNWSKVESYIDSNTFTDFENLAKGIRENFQTDIDKLYASYYFVTHHVQYDYPRSLIKTNRPTLSIDNIFTKRLGVCADYAKFMRELAKKVGITAKCMRILPFINASKAAGWNAFYPQENPDFDHEAVYIDIGGEKFISEPTWGAGNSDDNHQFSFSYVKSNFLIPYYTGVLSHYPQNILDNSLNYPFTWKQFISLNQPNISKELSLESNPFQKINVEDGFYELQFSFVQPVETLSSNIFLLEGNTWFSQGDKYVSFDCLAKDLPSRSYTLSSELRCRYNMSVCFPKVGTYHVEVFLNTKQLFHVYFMVKNTKERLLGIPGAKKEKIGFIPIVPLNGLTSVTKGFARIRFAIEQIRSPLLIELFKIKKGTFDREGNKKYDKCHRKFTTYLPFKYKAKKSDNKSNGNLNSCLVEDWILVEFPENGRWEVEIYFANDEGTYTYGVTYYFDVTGSGYHNLYPIFDLPKNRKFIPFQTKKPNEVWLEPSTQSVILNDYDHYFHVFSEKEVKVYFTCNEDDSVIWPSLMGEKDTDKKNIKDREYSVTFVKNGTYSLEIFGDQHLGTQEYYVTDFELEPESKAESNLMKDLKNRLEGKADYCKDIPTSVRKNVEKMLKDTKSQLDTKENKDSKPKDQKDQKPKQQEEQKTNNDKSDQNKKPTGAKGKTQKPKQNTKTQKPSDQTPPNPTDDQANQNPKSQKSNQSKAKQQQSKKPSNDQTPQKPTEDDQKSQKPNNDKTSQKPISNDQKTQKPKSQQSDQRVTSQKSENDASRIEYLMEMAVNFEKEKEALKNQIDSQNKSFEAREKALRNEFLREIDTLRSDWSLKDKMELNSLRDRARVRQQHLAEFEARERERSSLKKAEIKEKINNLEKQIKKHPEKKETIAVLYKQLIDIEDKEIEMITIRRQEQEEENKLDQLYYAQKKENERIEQLGILEKKEGEFAKSIADELQTHQKEKERLEKEYEDLKYIDESNSKCCLLI